ncbi:hypothetical protein ACP4OV_009918 [Aristida adscensionis]
MAAAHHRRLRLSLRAALLLSLLLPSTTTFSLCSLATAAEAPATLSDGGKEKEQKGVHGFDLCKLTGPFRFQVFGVVVECPNPPKDWHPFGPGGVHQPPVSPASAVPEEKGQPSSDGAAGENRGKDEL